MTDLQTKAIEKLRGKDQRLGANSKYANAVYEAVKNAMIGFCEQQEELADAVLQNEHTLGMCCEKIMERCGNSISDLEVYARVVEYFSQVVSLLGA